jgi:nitrite reductase (NADH) large subunit
MPAQQRVVVIGNGMAGARFVEELRARDPDRRVAITLFGDEPYGNYNRILLSSVLSGSHDPQDIFINPLAWYAENGVTLHAGVPAARIDRAAKRVFADRTADPLSPWERGSPTTPSSSRPAACPSCRRLRG